MISFAINRPVSSMRGLARQGLRRVLPLLVLLLASGPVLSDWAELATFGGIAEFSVVPGEIRLNLRLKSSAAPTGLGLSDRLTAGSPPAWLAVWMPVIKPKNGKPYTGHLLSLEHKTDGLVALPAGADNGSEAYVEATLVYPIKERLQGFSIVPPQGANQAIGLVLLHRGVPVCDLLPLKKTVNLSLDWPDPWRSRFDDPEFARQHAQPRSYLYLEPFEVRHELLLRLDDLKPWLNMGLQDIRYVEAGEKEALKRKIGHFLMARNPLNIDGANLVPQLDRVDFIRFDRSGVAPVGEDIRLETKTALVGVMLTYLTDRPARSIRLRWDLFGPNTGDRQVKLIQGKESFDAYMTSKHPVFEWSQDEALAPLPLGEGASDLTAAASIQAEPSKGVSRFIFPWLLAAIFVGLSLLLFIPRIVERGAANTGLGLLFILAMGLMHHPFPGGLAGNETHAPGALAENQAKTLLQSLLHNAYRAFQLHDEEKAYDRLAQTLDGDLLGDIYLQQRKALLRQAKGLGGEGKVDRVEVLEAHAQGLGQHGVVQVTSRWLAHGTVSHWGHTHERHNLYQARLILKEFNQQGWKIVGMEFLDGQSLEPGAS